MSLFRAELHIHSCLSPCADEDMTPCNLAGMASLEGIGIAALTDHNTAANCPAFFEACHRYGITPLGGMELTTAEDVTIQNYERIARPIISRLSGKVASRLQRDGVFGSTITVSVKTNDFRRHSRQRKLGASTNEETVIRRNAEELIQSLLYEENGIFDRGAGVRLIGVGVSSLDRGEYRQLDLEGFLLQQKEEKKREAVRRKEKCLDEMMKRLQERYGADTIHKGTD